MPIKQIAFIAFFIVSTFAYGDDYALPDNSAPAPAPADVQGSAQNSDKKSKCEQEWAKYKESQACFAKYVMVRGRVNAEAYKHCTEVKQPELLCN